jgi:hypothetical protein
MTTPPNARVCLWCERPFPARRGGSPKRFCCAAHRIAFWSAVRRWAERAVAAGVLSLDQIRKGALEACTLPGCSEPPLPLCDIGAGDSAPGDALRFVVDIERSKIDWLVRFRLIRSDQRDDLLVVMNGLKYVGQPPSISRA